MKVFLIGFMGAGKSHWGRQLAGKLSVPFHDLDAEIETAAGKTVGEVFTEGGEEGFRRLEREQLLKLTEATPTFVMATGGGTPCFFNNIDYMKREGTVVWLNATVETLVARLRPEKAKRPLIRDLGDGELAGFVRKKYSGRKIFYQQAHLILPEETLDLDTLVTQIFHANR